MSVITVSVLLVNRPSRLVNVDAISQLFRTIIIHTVYMSTLFICKWSNSCVIAWRESVHVF